MKMLLKIQYGPLSTKYFTDFVAIDYTSHLDDDASIVVARGDLGDNIFLNEKFLEKENGCCKHEDTKNAWYVNRIMLTQKKGEDPIMILYTGDAYLMNQDGKTVDMLR